MAQITKVINGPVGGVLNRDADFMATSEYLIKAGVVEGLQVTSGSVSAGKAFIQVTRTSIIPNETWIVYFQSTEAVTIDTTGTKKVYIQINQNNINDATLNTNPLGIGIGEIKTSSAYPASNYIPLASITSGVVTDERVFAKIKGDIDIATDSTTTHTIGTATKTVFLGDGSQLSDITIDIDTLTEDNTLGANDTLIYYKGGVGNRKRLATASTTVPGIIEIATNAEVVTGLDDVRVVTPKTLKDNYFYTVNGTKTTTAITIADGTRLTTIGTPIYIPNISIGTLSISVPNSSDYSRLEYSTDGVSYSTLYGVTGTGSFAHTFLARGYYRYSVSKNTIGAGTTVSLSFTTSL